MCSLNEEIRMINPTDKPLKQKAVICDIDGTLAHKGDRHIFAYEKAGVDTIDENVRLILQGLKAVDPDIKIVICSGRMDYGAEVLVDWLEYHGVPFDDLYMRVTDDYRGDEIVKPEIYFRDIEPKYNVMFVLDDRQKVVDMWRDIGLTCLQVAPGDF